MRNPSNPVSTPFDSWYKLMSTAATLMFTKGARKTNERRACILRACWFMELEVLAKCMGRLNDREGTIVLIPHIHIDGSAVLHTKIFSLILSRANLNWST